MDGKEQSIEGMAKGEVIYSRGLVMASTCRQQTWRQ
jgi:hypothetical protein